MSIQSRTRFLPHFILLKLLFFWMNVNRRALIVRAALLLMSHLDSKLNHLNLKEKLDYIAMWTRVFNCETSNLLYCVEK